MIRILQILLLTLFMSCSSETDLKQSVTSTNGNPRLTFQKIDTILEIENNIPCDVIYDTITQEKYIMHKVIMNCFVGTKPRNYLNDQDVSALLQHLNPEENDSYYALSNRVIFLMLENSVKNFDFGLTVWPISEKKFTYFFEHISNPICNNLSIDSIISIVQTNYSCHNTRSEELKSRTIKSLEIALEKRNSTKN